MDTDILKKLIAMKDERMSSLAAEAHALNAQHRELSIRLEDIKQQLLAIESARDEIVAEKSMLVQAIGGQDQLPPGVSGTGQAKSNEFIADILGDHTQAATPIDLEKLDLSDGEPKVRQHTIDVRRYAVLVTLRGGPRSTAELISEFEKLGFKVAEENAVANLSAILSRTSFFRSEKRRWHLDKAKLLSAPRLKK